MTLIRRDHQRPPFHCCLTHQSLAQYNLPRLVWSIERKAADANQTSMTLVGDIQSPIKQRDGLRKMRKQTSRNCCKILGGLQLLSDSRNLGPHPVLEFALMSARLKSAQCTADRTDFIGLVQIGDFSNQMSISKCLHACSYGQQLAYLSLDDRKGEN